MVITSDKNGRTDGSGHTLCQQIPSKYPIVIVSWVEGFLFNEALRSIKDYALVCFCEYGWNYEISDSHIWGVNTDKNGYGDRRYAGSEWDKFDNWVKENPPKLLLKRELLKKDVTDTVQPIEYPCIIKKWDIQTQEQFNNRPINCFQYWGRSNEERLRVHSEIWLHSYSKGFQVCDNMYYIQGYMDNERGEKWITLWIPHYHRIDINLLMDVNSLSKLSLSWQGAGFKCFRTGEAPVNSVLVMNKNNFAWTFDWNENNCVLVNKNSEIEEIENALSRKDLYSIYVEGVNNVDKYRIENYVAYLENLINNA